MRGLRILIIMTVMVAVFGVGAFLYMTREIAAPSEAVQASVQQPETGDDSSSVSSAA
jgi:Flp pilus assembly protein CpaB